MAIDAELNAGSRRAKATERRAKIRKKRISTAPDGASKFAVGAVAAILITAINVLGGIAIGMLQHGLPVADAVQRFTLLSIGDGLVSQIPGLIVSLAAGVLVTRTSGASDNLGDQIGGQLSAYPKAMGLLAFMLFGIRFIPSMPVPFFP